ncbi:hypothetical protein BTJ68_05932 [Hortaea werneckii EXF-2000]|uniref:Heterokaryon incompatibility domain-containing protein n=2 Tax=Hortaea werneckii TaxID=91943 RepID=A0A3M7J1D2_HORWE|nr:hypothetical protein BTJ68_05932 [Hortaea werneckii EXF-2000]RMZ31587.1 hypothetical protein D0859_04312 [Hortaea werneckii]
MQQSQRAIEPSFAFTYTPLGLRNLRFIRILPGAFDEDLSCEVLVLDQDTAPKYTAISYTWGTDFRKGYKIRIAGYELSVGGNCLYALRQARYFLEQGTLVWIDAICINQSDLQEKGRQVSRMGEIYQQADRVFACIGRMGENTDHELLRLLSAQNDRARSDFSGMLSISGSPE